MDTVSVTFEIPKEVIGDVPYLSQYSYEKLVLGLYLDEEISLGKAAKLLDMSYDEFIQLLGKNGIPYFWSQMRVGKCCRVIVGSDDRNRNRYSIGIGRADNVVRERIGECLPLRKRVDLFNVFGDVVGKSTVRVEQGRPT